MKNGEGTYDASQEAALKAELVGRLNDIDPDVVATLNALTAKVNTVGFGRNQTESTEMRNMYQTVLDTLARTSPVGGNTGDPYTVEGATAADSGPTMTAVTGRPLQ